MKIKLTIFTSLFIATNLFCSGGNIVIEKINQQDNQPSTKVLKELIKKKCNKNLSVKK